MINTKLATLCNQEWSFFGKQEYNLEGNIIVQGKQEFDDGITQRIGTYWNFLGYHLDGRDRDWPWSATFVSYMQHLAGSGTKFLYSIRHSDYLNQAIMDKDNPLALYNGLRINECPIKVGDILGYSRKGANIDYDNAVSKGRYTSHSDIVVAVHDDEIEVMGGNVGDSVSKRRYKLSNGKLDENIRPWIAHMSINLEICKG